MAHTRFAIGRTSERARACRMSRKLSTIWKPAAAPTWKMCIRDRIKVQVKGPSTTYTYNLTPGSEGWTTFPLSDGNGWYQVVVYRNISGTKYSQMCIRDRGTVFTGDGNWP